jgi:lipid A 3-O-deacylase
VKTIAALRPRTIDCLSCTRCALATLALMLSLSGQAANSLMPDALAGTVGYGADVAIYGASADWNLSRRGILQFDHGLDVRLSAQIAYWRGKGQPTPYGSLWDVSLTPFLRWTPASSLPLRMYLEAGIGAHVLSEKRINNDRDFGMLFQFGEQVGAGVLFGEANRYELGVYVQHISNAQLKHPNWGITYPAIVFRAQLP